MLRPGSAAIGLALGLHGVLASASPFTTTSPTGGALPVGVTEIGGIVLDLTGVNGARVVSQVSASSLFKGYFNTGTPKAHVAIPASSASRAASRRQLPRRSAAASVPFCLGVCGGKAV